MRCISYMLHFIFLFFFTDPATTEIYTLSLHDALPISRGTARRTRWRAGSSCTPDSSEPSASRRRRWLRDQKSTRLNSSHGYISHADFCLKKKKIRAGVLPNAAHSAHPGKNLPSRRLHG